GPHPNPPPQAGEGKERTARKARTSAAGSSPQSPASSQETPASNLLEWEVPFEFPEDWPQSARAAFDAFHEARIAMQRKMDASIAAHADQETLYDQPVVSKNKRRITGPFTVEAVPFPSVLSLDDSEQPKEADVAIARSGESARQHAWRDELIKTGIPRQRRPDSEIRGSGNVVGDALSTLLRLGCADGRARRRELRAGACGVGAAPGRDGNARSGRALSAAEDDRLLRLCIRSRGGERHRSDQRHHCAQGADEHRSPHGRSQEGARDQSKL